MPNAVQTAVCKRWTSGALALVVSVCLAQLHSPTFAQFDPAKVAAQPEAIARQFPDPQVPPKSPGFAPNRTDFTLHAESLAFLQGLSQQSTRIALEPLGASQQGRSIVAAVLTGQRGFDAKLPTVMLLALQHGNEPAGGEAALVIAQMLSQQRSALLERVNVVIVPRVNPDAAERFGRESANGIDVNRDHLLLRTPEASAVASAIARFSPQVVADLHEFTVAGRWMTKFGAVMRDDALLQGATVGNLSPIVDRAQARYLQVARSAIEQAGYRMADYHTASNDPKDLTVSMGGVNADTGRNVAGLRNTISLLIETRGVGIGRAHFARRVNSHVLASMALIETAASDGAALVQMQRSAESQLAQRSCSGSMAVSVRQTPQRRELSFLDATSGAPREVSVDWRSSLVLTLERERSWPCGYLVAATQSLALQRLRDLGVRLDAVQTNQLAQTWQVENYIVQADLSTQRQDARGAIADAQGNIRLLQVQTQPQQLALIEPAFYVSMDQPLAALIAAALEPDTQNSFAANRLVTIEAGQLRRVMRRPDPASLKNN